MSLKLFFFVLYKYSIQCHENVNVEFPYFNNERKPSFGVFVLNENLCV